MNYLPTFGLEIHSQLATNTKIFCGCSTGFGSDPNSHSCPVCLGMPGVLPVLNRRAIELAVRVALLTGGDVQRRSYFARKNYFYPDLPKGYQISMYEFPLIKGGGIEVETEQNGRRFIHLNRIHLEEDAGKLIHADNRDASYFDVNRCGVPLIEIVTEPDFETLDEVAEFLDKLRDILVFSGASEGNMFRGNIRVDANISIRPEGQTELGTRTEIKNMNSFANAITAIRLEILRQTELVESGGAIIQQTLLFDADREALSPMRSKEEAHDYRYFPEPDLVPVVVNEEWVERIRAELPELREQLMERFQSECGLPEYDAGILTSTPGMALYFEAVIRCGANPKKASNWIMGEVMRILNERQIEIAEFPVKANDLAKLIAMIDAGSISGSIAKTVFDEMTVHGGDPENIVAEKGLLQISDKGELEAIVRRIVSAHPDEALKFREGKKQLMGFFVGQIMRETKGKANPREVNELLKDMLS